MTIYTKTELGQLAFKQRSSALSARQRAAFILIDGKRLMRQVIEATAGMGIGPADFQYLLDCGYVSAPDGSPLPEPPAASPGLVTTTSAPLSANGPAAELRPDALYMRAYPIATQLVSSLGLRGFRLNLAVESASGYQQLVELLPRIREAVGVERCLPLERALQP